MDNADIAIDYFEGFCDIQAEIKAGDYDEDKTEKREVQKAAKLMMGEHFKALVGVTKRSIKFIDKALLQLGGIQKKMAADATTARERMGAATSQIEKEVTLLAKEVALMNGKIGAYNTALKAT